MSAERCTFVSDKTMPYVMVSTVGFTAYSFDLYNWVVNDTQLPLYMGQKDGPNMVGNLVGNCMIPTRVFYHNGRYAVMVWSSSEDEYGGRLYATLNGIDWVSVDTPGVYTYRDCFWATINGFGCRDRENNIWMSHDLWHWAKHKAVNPVDDYRVGGYVRAHNTNSYWASTPDPIRYFPATGGYYSRGAIVNPNYSCVSYDGIQWKVLHLPGVTDRYALRGGAILTSPDTVRTAQGGIPVHGVPYYLYDNQLDKGVYYPAQGIYLLGDTDNYGGLRAASDLKYTYKSLPGLAEVNTYLVAEGSKQYAYGVAALRVIDGHVVILNSNPGGGTSIATTGSKLHICDKGAPIENLSNWSLIDDLLPFGTFNYWWDIAEPTEVGV